MQKMILSATFTCLRLLTHLDSWCWTLSQFPRGRFTSFSAGIQSRLIQDSRHRFSLKKKEGATEKDYAEYFQVKLNVPIDNVSEHAALVKRICADALLESPLFVRCPLGDGSTGALSALLTTFSGYRKVHVER